MNIIAFIISFGLFAAGFWLMGFAFQTPGLETVTFLGGLAACCVGVAIPVHVLKRLD